jgi:hypothetical protein
MNHPELVLLSPHHLPGQNPLVLGNEDMACWMNAYSALWHPAALWQAAGPPRVDSAYEHEEPKPGHIYAVPESPHLLLPDDWLQRVQAAGACTFRATPDRATTLKSLRDALGNNPAFRARSVSDGTPPHPENESVADAPGSDPGLVRQNLLDVGTEITGPFFGIGLGHVLVATLCEAMEHENLLAADEFWQDVQKAIAALAGVPYQDPTASDYAEPESPPQTTDVGDTGVTDDYGNYSGYQTGEDFQDGDGMEDNHPADAEDYDSSTAPATAAAAEEVFGAEACRPHLQAAADRLQSAREVLYPVAIHVIDLFLVNDQQVDVPLPAAVERGLALNLIASSALLEKMDKEHPNFLAVLREKVQSEQIEVCGGSYLEREDPLLPIESQIWNLAKGLAVAKEVLGSEIRVYARKRTAAHPQLPMLLGSVGLQRAVLLSFDEAVLPTYQVTVVNWPSPDGKQIEAFTRAPYPADNPQTFFHLAHYLYQTIRQDHAATLALLHSSSSTAPWYDDWLELCRFGSIVGQWTTLSHYFNDVLAGEHASALSADEFQSDYLSQRTAANLEGPVSGFAHWARTRRRIDTIWSLAAMHRGLVGQRDSLRLNDRLAGLEDHFEAGNADLGPELLEVEKEVLQTVGNTLLAHASSSTPGYLVLNPCSFTRRLALELDGATVPLPVAGLVKACQLDGSKMRLVVEVPGVGFAWFPQAGPVGTPPPALRMRLADNRCVRNEFFEAEIDQETGGLRALRDHRTRNNRIGQRLIFNPGGVARASSVTVTSAGPALGEIVTEGAILGEQEQVLARFRQRFRAWLGRPVLDLRLEIYPEQPPAGYPWHAYYGARFAWRDERAMLLRGLGGTGYITTQTRPQTPDYLEVRMGRQNTIIFPGGLPFHQRHENRMLDIVLVPEGEKGQTFDLALGLDREHPMQTALGLVTPVSLLPTTKGPPHVGAAGWLFHLDATNLLLTGMRPLARGDDGFADAVLARMVECGAYGGQADLRCPRDPRRAVLLDVRGEHLLDAGTQGDAASFEVMPSDLINLQVDFS